MKYLSQLAFLIHHLVFNVIRGWWLWSHHQCLDRLRHSFGVENFCDLLFQGCNTDEFESSDDSLSFQRALGFELFLELLDLFCETICAGFVPLKIKAILLVFGLPRNSQNSHLRLLFVNLNCGVRFLVKLLFPLLKEDVR